MHNLSRTKYQLQYLCGISFLNTVPGITSDSSNYLQSVMTDNHNKTYRNATLVTVCQRFQNRGLLT